MRTMHAMNAFLPKKRFGDFPLQHGAPNNFDFLRYFLAVVVILSHSFPLMYGRNELEPFFALSGGQYSGGSIAVDLFLLISGFLVTHSWMGSRNPVLFLSKRVRRVYPGYLGAVTASLVLVWAVSPAGKAFLEARLFEPVFWLSLLTFTLPPIPGLLQGNPFPDYINGSLWTILYEFACYLFLAMLGILGVLRRRLLVLGLFCLIWLIYSGSLSSPAMYEALRASHLHQWPRMLACFLVGTVFYLYRDRIPYSAQWAAISGAIGLALFFSGHGFVLMLPIVGAYVVFYLAFARGLPFANFGKRGDLSYGVYLYAFPIQQLLIAGLQPWLNPWTLFALAWGITVICAWLSWTYIERPFLRR